MRSSHARSWSCLVRGSAWVAVRVSAATLLATSGARGAANQKGATADGPDTVNSCVDSHLLAQEARQDGRLLESRTRLRQCAVERCPELVRVECARLLEELRVQVPTVIFRVTVDGETHSDVSAYIGERLLFSEIPTRALEFDPGKYHFRFQFGKLAPIERDISIAEGDRFMPITVAFEDPTSAAARKTKSASNGDESRPSGAGLPPSPSAEPTTGAGWSVPWPVYALVGLGVIGGGSFVGFGLASKSKESHLRDTCSPRCSAAEIEPARRLALFADISLGVGTAAFATAITYYLLRPGQKVRVGAAISPAGSALTQVGVDF